MTAMIRKKAIATSLENRGDRESDFLGFREASGLDTISRHFPAGSREVCKYIKITKSSRVNSLEMGNVYPF